MNICFFVFDFFTKNLKSLIIAKKIMTRTYFYTVLYKVVNNGLKKLQDSKDPNPYIIYKDHSIMN